MPRRSLRSTSRLAAWGAVCAAVLASTHAPAAEPAAPAAATVSVAAVRPVAASLSLASALSAADLAARLGSSSRSQEDRLRDVERRPAEVIAFLGIAPGATVLDLIAAGGWNTEVLAVAVGPAGRVYAQNTAFALQVREGANEKALAARLAGDRLPNVVRLDAEFDALGLAPDSVDAAMTALNFHDIYNGAGAEAAAGFLTAVKNVLRPGGVFGIVDHVGVAGADNTALHRIEPKTVEALAVAAGFVVEARSDVLARADDDHTKNVFDPAVRGRTDCFVLRLRKPTAD